MGNIRDLHISKLDGEEPLMPTSTKKPNSRPVFRWLSHLTCPVMVIIAVVMAFPRVIGSNDDPTYALAVVFLSLAVMFGALLYGDRLERARSKQVRIFLAANEYAAGNITLEEYGSQTKEIMNDR